MIFPLNVFILKHYIQYNKLDVSAFFLIFQVGKCDPILSHNSTSQYRLKHSASFRGSLHHRSPIGRGESSSCSQISRQPIRYCIILSHHTEFYLKFNAQPSHFNSIWKKIHQDFWGTYFSCPSNKCMCTFYTSCSNLNVFMIIVCSFLTNSYVCSGSCNDFLKTEPLHIHLRIIFCMFIITIW